MRKAGGTPILHPLSPFRKKQLTKGKRMQNKEPFSYSGAIFTLLLSTETSLMARAVTVSIPEHEP